ncbi:MAG TPA: efflux RND transporter periplasmic adaptor subunit [Dissulfurispiraceae bacterium]|nr:efflux RND transporter periplasmic adaptor subunit [Dissulfurispiraceae bacterium]
MNRKILLIIGAAIIAAAAIAFYVMNPAPAKKAPVAQVQPPAESKNTDAPAQQNTEQAQDQAEAPTVEISPEQQQLIGVKTVTAEIKPMRKIIRTVGLVAYDERRLSTVNTKFDGWIEKLHVDYSGRYVRKGEPLADIYSPELLATQQEFINLLKWKNEERSIKNQDIGSMLSRDSNVIIEGARQRLRLWDISDEQIDKIEKTGKPIRSLTIYSPVSGYVVQKSALKGARVAAGEKLFDIADLSTVWILSDIFEYELPLVKPGEKAIISLSYFPGKEFSSDIDYVYPTISGETRSAKVRFTVPNPGNRLKPQMYTNVEVKINIGKKLVVPEDAVLDAGKRQVVYVDKGEGNFEPREVGVGMRSDGMIEISNGLQAGERVASSANFLIDSEAKLKGVVK